MLEELQLISTIRRPDAFVPHISKASVRLNPVPLVQVSLGGTLPLEINWSRQLVTVFGELSGDFLVGFCVFLRL